MQLGRVNSTPNYGSEKKQHVRNGEKSPSMLKSKPFAKPDKDHRQEKSELPFNSNRSTPIKRHNGDKHKLVLAKVNSMGSPLKNEPFELGSDLTMSYKKKVQILHHQLKEKSTLNEKQS